MKKTKMLLGLCVLALGSLSTAGWAQTCNSPINLTSGATGSGNTCSDPTGTGSNTIGQYCGIVGSPENEIIYSITLGSGATGNFAISNVQAGFNAAIVLFQAPDATACQVASNCIGLPSDDNGAGAGETLPFTGDAAGNYYIAVTGSPGTNGCGSYDYTVTGPLPVKLEKFSVE